MAGGVNEVDRVVVDIAVAVEALGVAGVRNDRIRGNKAPQGGIIVAGMIEVQPRLGVLLLPGVPAPVKVVVRGVGFGGGFAEGEVGEALDLGSRAVRQKWGT